MKELSIEEKAKAYDEAIERAIKHRNNDGLTLEQYETIDIILPELTESEDERIRKDLISHFKETIDNIRSEEIIPRNAKILVGKMQKWIAWLEEQGNWELVEQKPTWTEEDENRFKNLIYLVEHSDEGKATKEGFIKFINRLKSLK